MKHFYTLILSLFAFLAGAHAQNSLYGVIDTAELKLNTCSFDKGATAMVLFNIGKLTYTNRDGILMERYKRIKIFNSEGTTAGNVRLEFWNGLENISNIQAQTINLTGSSVQVTPLDKKLIYKQKIDKQRTVFIFTLPNVKAGSVIELKYTWRTDNGYHIPTWLFQDILPTAYSEFAADVSFGYNFNIVKKTTLKLKTDTAYFVPKAGAKNYRWIMENVPGFRVEPYMRSIEDNLQAVYFKSGRLSGFWDGIADEIKKDEDFGGQLKLPLAKEIEIINNANEIKIYNEKLAYLFNTVKNTLKWNKVNKWYTDDGTQKAWLAKTGNSTEINLILYHLLKASGIKATLLVLGTRDEGEIELTNPSFDRLNKTVVRVPIDSLNFFVLDACGKYNTYNNTPADLLNLNMLLLDLDSTKAKVVQLKTDVSSKEVVFINAEISADGKLQGVVQKTLSNYKRTEQLETFDELGEKQYIKDELQNGNTAIEIGDHKFFNTETDTIPLREDFSFKLELTGSDQKYIYFSPNLFTGLGLNPFISELRLSDIDFMFLNNYNIFGRYKIPGGYKIDALPKPLTLVMPDKSIVFSRNVSEFEGAIVVKYKIDFRKTRYQRGEYMELRQFFKEMYDLINEQIVLIKN